SWAWAATVDDRPKASAIPKAKRRIIGPNTIYDCTRSYAISCGRRVLSWQHDGKKQGRRGRRFGHPRACALDGRNAPRAHRAAPALRHWSRRPVFGGIIAVPLALNLLGLSQQ